MQIKFLIKSMSIEERLDNLVCEHWSYQELSEYLEKYKRVYEKYNLPLDYIFKYFGHPASQVNGAYVFLGINEETEKVIFGRIYLPKIHDWGKYHLEVRLKKFLHTKYEISDSPIEKYIPR